MYFLNRRQAGEQLAQELFHAYAKTDSVVLVVDDMSLQTAEPIARHLDLPIVRILMREIPVPGEPVNIGTVDQAANFTYSSDISHSEVEEYEAEFRNQIEATKMESMHRINEQLGPENVEPHDLNDKNVILVMDGLNQTSLIDAVLTFLKPVRIKRTISAIPVVSVPVVDRLHIATDEMHVLDVKANYFSTDHYYEENKPLSEDQVSQLLERYKLR